MVLRKMRQESEIALRHLLVLHHVWKNQPIGIFKLSEILKMPKHRVRYSLRVLEQSGIIEPTQYGAVIKKGAEKEIERLKKEVEEILENTRIVKEKLNEL
jgi:predicted transcriptional regulator